MNWGKSVDEYLICSNKVYVLRVGILQNTLKCGLNACFTLHPLRVLHICLNEK